MTTQLRRGQLRQHGESKLLWKKALRLASPFLLLLLWEAM